MCGSGVRAERFLGQKPECETWLTEAGKFLGIRVLDHVRVARKATTVFRKQVLIKGRRMANRVAFAELFQTFEECRQPNWDGYAAQPVSAEIYNLAYEFLTALPPGTPDPSLGAEPDGHITAEWYRSPQRTLSVSVSPDGELHYAALLGSAKTCGTEPLTGAVPKVVADLIHRVTVA
jgi:hypothetical protein